MQQTSLAYGDGTLAEISPKRPDNPVYAHGDCKILRESVQRR
jgi:hypothetical protein